jgi:F0F1-type ATP synthase alpha subunit
MTILEKKSLRKKKAIFSLVEKGEYSPAYALILVEELSDNGKLTDSDYEELAEYLENLLNEVESTEEETSEEITEETDSEEEQEDREGEE